jgi:hypothetical protein
MEAVRNLNFTTFYGQIAFTSTGENLAKGMVSTQIINGKIEIISPLDVKTADFVYPITHQTSTTSSESDAAIIQSSLVLLSTLLAVMLL